MAELRSFIPGGSFLVESILPEQVMTPEELTEEHVMIAKTTQEFVKHEVLPALPVIERQHRYSQTVQLLRRAGELGLLGADIPEEYGGLGLDKVSSALITEYMATGRSFALSFGAHVGIGTLPIVFFGSEEQKRKYLPSLASGEKIAAYALTEPSAGSDALGAKTVAKLSSCGQYYLLTGEKQWITNSGFADLFIVYAKVDGEHFTAFIVERGYEGVSTGPEEEKMGIRGSSTCTLILEEAKVPVENVLGQIGQGHRIAFNILNIGRYKLAVGCVGSTKRLLEISVKYAKERKQFSQPIAQFNLIKNKLANMAIRTFVNESMVYRTTGLLDERLGQLSAALSEGHKVAQAMAEYAVECSINKVYGSEALDEVADEAVQIHGGYGYMSQNEVENAYRDSRINRIFEGTNEINRLLIPATLLRKVMKGELDLLSKARGLEEDLLMLIPEEPDERELLAKEKQHVELAKKLFLMTAGTALERFQKELEQEQELLAILADMVIEIYAMESAILRTEKAVVKHGLDREQQKMAYTQVYVQEAWQRMEVLARESLAATEEGDRLRTLLAIVRKLTRHTPINTVALKRQIAQRIIEAEKYVV